MNKSFIFKKAYLFLKSITLFYITYLPSKKPKPLSIYILKGYIIFHLYLFHFYLFHFLLAYTSACTCSLLCSYNINTQHKHNKKSCQSLNQQLPSISLIKQTSHPPNHYLYNKIIKTRRCSTLTWRITTLPSTLRPFTSEFGMGSGGTIALSSSG